MSVPRNIIAIKSHSAGIGDLLMSSAAWKSMKMAYPGCKIHLLFLTDNPGYNSENFVARHHLLSSFRASDKRRERKKRWNNLLREAAEFGDRVQPDLVIDFEPNGMTTPILAWYLGRRYRVPTAGIAQFPLRRWFFRHVAPSTQTFARKRGLAFPLHYPNRDYVALSALGIERNNTPIELRETREGFDYRKRFLTTHPPASGSRILGLNIGCGTTGAGHRRPSLDVLSRVCAELQERDGMQLAVGLGAPFEVPFDNEFVELHRKRCNHPILHLNGSLSLTELTGFLCVCDLFITGDTGPYHMSVGLRTPTLCILNAEAPSSLHHSAWVKNVVAPTPDSAIHAVMAARELLAASTRSPVPRLTYLA